MSTASATSPSKWSGYGKLSDYYGKLHDYLIQLTTSDLSAGAPNTGFPSILINDLSLEDRIDLAARSAVLAHLYGDTVNVRGNITEEAFVWTRYGRKLLCQLGWLHGTLVIVDFDHHKLSFPSVEEPHVSLCPPWISPNDVPFLQQVGPIMAEPLEAHWDEIIERLPELRGRQDGDRIAADLKQLVSQYLDPDTTATASTYLQGNLLSQITYTAEGILSSFRTTQSGDQPGDGTADEEMIAAAVQEGLVEYLAGAVVAAHLVNKRQEHYDALARLLPRLATGRLFTRNESELGVILIKDPEILLMVLEDEYLQLQQKAGPQACCHTAMTSDLLVDLGLLHAGGEGVEMTPRAEMLARFLQRLFFPPAEDAAASADDYFEITDFRALPENRWSALCKKLGDEDSLAELRRLTDAILDKPQGTKPLLDLCDLMFRGNTQPGNPLVSTYVNPGIQRFLRYRQTRERHHVIFPLTRLRYDQSTGGSGMCAMFFGTIGKARAKMRRRDQIVAIRALANTLFGPTIRQTLEMEERERYQARVKQQQEDRVFAVAYVFGHDLKNRLDELPIRRSLERLKDLPVGQTKETTYCLTSVQSLYAYAELLRTLVRASDGRLPREWLDASYRGGWPEAFDAARDLPRIADIFRAALHQRVAAYVHSLENPPETFVLREVTDVGPRELPLPDAVSVPHGLPPFDGSANDAASQVILVGLAELVRNAVKVVLDPSDRGPLTKGFGTLHLDYQISFGYRDIRVDIWNPFLGSDEPGRARAVDSLMAMYRPLPAVRIEPVCAVSYDYAYSPGKRYALSRFAYRPADLRFGTEDSHS